MIEFLLSSSLSCIDANHLISKIKKQREDLGSSVTTELIHEIKTFVPTWTPSILLNVTLYLLKLLLMFSFLENREYDNSITIKRPKENFFNLVFIWLPN